MPVKLIRRVGRPTLIEEAIALWATAFLSNLEEAQITLGFTASGDSSKQYEAVISRNEVETYVAEYLKYSIQGVGRHPGGKMPPLEAIVRWLEIKGYRPSDPKMSLKSFAYLIARKQQREGNKVYRGERAGIPLSTIIETSFDDVDNEMALMAARQAADQLEKSLTSTKTFKSK